MVVFSKKSFIFFITIVWLSGASFSPAFAKDLSEHQIFSSLMALFSASRKSDFEPLFDDRMRAASQTQSPYFAYQAALLALSEKHPQKALRALSAWISLEPESEYAHILFGVALMLNDESKKALDYLEDRIKHPKSPAKKSLERIISALTRYSDKNEAVLDFFSALITRTAVSLDLVFGLKAKLAINLHFYDRALSILQTAIESGHATVSVIGLFQALSKRTQSQKQAISFLEKSLAHRKQMLHLDEEKWQKLKIRILLSLANMSEDRNTPEKALSYYEKILQLHPKQQKALFASGRLQMHLDRLKEAKSSFNKHLNVGKKETDRDKSRFNLGLIALSSNDPFTATKHFSAIQSDSLAFDASIQLARALRMTKGAEKALSVLAKLRPKKVGQWKEWYFLKRLYLLDQGQKHKALKTARFVLHKVPEDLDVLFDAGILASELGLLDESFNYLTSILKKKPDHANAKNALGYTLTILSDRYLEALELITDALKHEPENAAFLDSLGWVYFKMGNLDQALHYLTTAFSFEPSSEIGAHLAETLFELGHHQRAQATLLLSLQYQADNEPLLDTIERLFPEMLNTAIN